LAKISILKIPETVKSDQTKMRNAQPSLESPLNGGIYLKISLLGGVAPCGREDALIFLLLILGKG
jgi:hypothetical protein